MSVLHCPATSVRCSAGRVGFGMEDATSTESGVGENEAMGSVAVAVEPALHAERNNVNNKIKRGIFIYLSSALQADPPSVRGSQKFPPQASAWTYPLLQV